MKLPNGEDIFLAVFVVLIAGIAVLIWLLGAWAIADAYMYWKKAGLIT